MLDLLSSSNPQVPPSASVGSRASLFSSDKQPEKEPLFCPCTDLEVCSTCAEEDRDQTAFNQTALTPNTVPLGVSTANEGSFYADTFLQTAMAQDVSVEQAALEQDAFIHSAFSQDLAVHEAFTSDEREAVKPETVKPEIVRQEIVTPVLFPPETIAQAVAEPRPFEPGLPAFDLLPVGMMVDGRTAVFSVLVRGAEDGTQAIDFERWLVPWDTVKTALSLSVTPLDNGQLEIRSPFLVTTISADELQYDPDLGEVLSVQQLRNLLGDDVVTFDLIEYAIAFDLRPQTQQSGLPETSILLDGLASVNAPALTVGAIEQHSRFASTSVEEGQAHLIGDLQAVGTAFGGSWYVDANQGNVTDLQTWSVTEAQYLRETPFADYVVGSHPPFWSNRNQEFWGFSSIQRQGFSPPSSSQEQGFSPQQRLQSGQVEQTVVGEAQPGTLVQLTQGNQSFVVDERLVDSSGTFRFDDVPIDHQSERGQYQLQLFPNGRLASLPETREVSHSILAGQLPVGATATSVALGLGRAPSTAAGQGALTELRGGVGLRWGLSESTTIGLGGVYDDGWQGLGELFFKPTVMPLELSARFLSGTDGKDPEIAAHLNFQPFSWLDIDFRRDDLLEQVNVNWQVSSAWDVFGRYTTAGSYEAGAQFSWQKPRFSTYLRTSINERQNLRWDFRQRWGALGLSHSGNESGLSSELGYSLSGHSGFSQFGHDLLLGHEQQTATGNSLMTASWRYRSASRDINGNRDWAFNLGGGWGDQGSGLVASLETAALPGFLLRAQYRDVSLTSNEPEFSIELTNRFHTQRGIVPGAQQTNQLRGEGGVMLRPFFDHNANGVHDDGESYHTESADLLFILNNKPIQGTEPTVLNDRVLLALPSGSYRLDLDPAGIPLNWQAETTSMAVDVVAGSYTSVPIPFQPSYTVIGVVSTPAGNALAGARVEAIPENGLESIFSITNGAGVYVLEALEQGRYQLQVNEQLLEPSILEIIQTTEPFQEINLQTVFQ